MLILTRKVGERIRIGDVWVEVMRVEHGKVRLGIDAPRDMPVWREEVLVKKLRETAAPETGGEG
jgi:carbon storage regulator